MSLLDSYYTAADNATSCRDLEAGPGTDMSTSGSFHTACEEVSHVETSMPYIPVSGSAVFDTIPLGSTPVENRPLIDINHPRIPFELTASERSLLSSSSSASQSDSIIPEESLTCDLPVPPFSLRITPPEPVETSASSNSSTSQNYGTTEQGGRINTPPSLFPTAQRINWEIVQERVENFRDSRAFTVCLPQPLHSKS